VRAAANPVVQIDDDRFRVTEWQFAPGAETGWHRHGHDYVIVPLCDGQLALDLPGGQKATASLTQGMPYWRREGVEHNFTNGSDSAPLAFLKVEVVDDALAHRRQATMSAMMDAFNARDVEGVMACMAADCAFHASAGPEAEGQRHIGRDAVLRATAAVFEAFPEAAWTDGMHVVAGDTGLSSWRFVERRPDGSPVDVRGCDVFGFDGDLIAVKDSYRKPRG
jgi:quercetin dioxygenase-like cupin family protein/ketosteroid isomerase-like protein